MPTPSFPTPDRFPTYVEPASPNVPQQPAPCPGTQPGPSVQPPPTIPSPAPNRDIK